MLGMHKTTLPRRKNTFHSWLKKLTSGRRAKRGNEESAKSSVKLPIERNVVQFDVRRMSFESMKVEADGIFDVPKPRRGDSRHVPRFVLQCVRYLVLPDVVTVPQIFRTEGSAEQVNAIIALCNSDDGISYDKLVEMRASPHAVATLLKRTLRLQEDPLIPFKTASQLLNAIDSENMELFWASVNSMPEHKYSTLVFILRLLALVSMTPENEVNAGSLAVMFGQLLIRIEGEDDVDRARDNVRRKQIVLLLIEEMCNCCFPERNPEA